ncbi:hypothetical protein PE066_10855 [Ramlibacter tataouinensis]|uniref:hypothetical protein n=1 Tax=Ramlibacter tataouinensis TaxID=94132 RepID=UPI0022F3E3EB|nr:hypothetical protein [Ramlibacter tataouinensis]WBX99984.1 hypothetical protein PE066_10855 [Ramlibacter tataouinensis]
MVLATARRVWLWTLASVPRPVLRRLNGWARRSADRRAERRRRRLVAARQS